jgi:threonine aldolase
MGLKRSLSMNINFSSDNYAPTHPAILQAILEANSGYASAYGSDAWTKKAHDLISEILNRDCLCLMTPTGTGANVLSLKIACMRYESVISSDIGHINFQESGAFESVVGSKLLLVPHVHGKISIDSIFQVLNRERELGIHGTVPRALSIAQPTEVGTVYNLKEMKELSEFCKSESLLFHVDGSRIYNAAVSLNLDLAQIISALNCDILSLGGTKNGLMGAEAVVIFNSSLFKGAMHLHKQTLQLLSKMRYLSAQYVAFFSNNLWHSMAQNANLMAEQASKIIKHVPDFNLSYPVETNQIFVTTNLDWFKKLPEKISCLPWDQEKKEIRLITSWCTTNEDLENFKKVFTKL